MVQVLSCFLLDNYDLSCNHGHAAAGDNRVGQLGVLPRGAVFHPSPIKGAVRWASVALSAKHSIAIASDGKVYCWGLNDEGQLGRGTINQECSDPEPVRCFFCAVASLSPCRTTCPSKK
jgi:alpha-tubulin suppressor-like RCC1 family protein